MYLEGPFESSSPDHHRYHPICLSVCLGTCTHTVLKSFKCGAAETSLLLFKAVSELYGDARISKTGLED